LKGGIIMRGMVIRWLTLTLAILLAAYLMDGIHISGFGAALGAAAILGILNAFFRPIALLLTLPINIMTLGLFTLVINAVLLKMVSGVVGGFEVHGFWTAVFGSLLISLVSWMLSTFIGDSGRLDVINLRHRGGNRWE
jgi:putative membrane protein